MSSSWDPSSLRASRTVQIVFVTLLLTCLGQVAWWVLDQNLYSTHMNEQIAGLYERDAFVALELINQDGIDEVRVRELFHDVELAADGTARIDPGHLETLRLSRDARLSRYYWEAGFFVVVLISTVGLIGVTLRARTELLRRQQSFLAAVSHELKSPLASLKLSAETLLLREPDKAGQTRIAERMVLSTERLAGMVTNLLDTARLDDDRVELTPERLELEKLVEQALSPISCSSHVHGVEITWDVPSDVAIFADAAAVQSVVSNLVSNAFKSAKANSGGKVEVSARREGARVRLDVKDDGVGFDPKIAHQLFERFFRPGNELVRRTKGSGLGLFIVKRFVELDGGRIDATSAGEGHGATFSVWWRTAEPTEPPPLAPEKGTVSAQEGVV
ncbi:MAG: HAMP domain-containing histidine kinase [Planctomycetes bacterium]|nr:HAMP domain-containing histidine kinase [Planctomycetota bacterium]